jgi:hypothetical protein
MTPHRIRNAHTPPFGNFLPAGILMYAAGSRIAISARRQRTDGGTGKLHGIEKEIDPIPAQDRFSLSG